MRKFAVIPSRSRRELLDALVTQLVAEDVGVIVVDNGYDPPYDEAYERGALIARHTENPPNLSRLWNIGLETAHRLAEEDYVVAVLNDDVILPTGFMSRLARVIDQTGAAAAFPDVHRVLPPEHLLIHREAKPVPLQTRLCGFAFALRGDAGIRADESLAWWYGDDDIDWTARTRGGSVLVGGLTLTHLHPNQTTIGVLAEQAGRDRQTFIAKWGCAPW